MKITDLIVDPRSIGNTLWLVDVVPAYEYKDNKKTDKIIAYRYCIALPEKGLDKIWIRIDGKKQMDAPDGYTEVCFENLELSICWYQNQYHVKATATGIYPVDNEP